jgi:hypothetical protein
MSKTQEVLKTLLHLELETQARRLQFIDGENKLVNSQLMADCIDVLNELSLKKDETSLKYLIAITALLWNYKNPDWNGLKSYLILFLSRAGFGPSSIMLDDHYSKTNGAYSFSQSIWNELAINAAQNKTEINIGKHRFLLTHFQRELWNNLDQHPLVGISAPTSAGKSYLILLKAIELLLAKAGTIIYIVPTLSLVNQVITDFRQMLNKFDLTDYLLESSFNINTHSSKSIYVLTQEKAIAAFSQADVPFQEIRLLVIDEIQNVERVTSNNDLRAKVLYDLMMEFRNTAKTDHIIVSGPRIGKIDQLSEDIFGQQAIKRETTSSPVLNLTYSIYQKKGKGKPFFFKVFCDLLKTPIETRITHEEMIKGYGGAVYSDAYLDYLNDLVYSFDKECVLVFSPNPDTCSKMAEYIGRKGTIESNEYLDDLAGFIATTVHPDYGLVSALQKGLAYHHGKLPSHVRPLIEHAIKNGNVKLIFATTTLLQGVNLPVQNIIIRNPKLYVREQADSVKLSKYELANLRGRAGRLLKDFVGRTFILDETSFMDQEDLQLDLFKGTEKELEVGYGKKYTDHKSLIQTDIKNNIGSTDNNREYSFITTYLRQTILKHGINSQTKLSRVGIEISNKELNEILFSLSKLTIDKKVCASNRYWDPIDLNSIHESRIRFELPTRSGEYGNADKLKKVLQHLEKNYPIYYDRNFKVYNTATKDLVLQMCILADKWANETSLVDILKGPFYDSTEKIDTAIEHLESKISYGLALLLKPVYDIKLPGSMYPRFIEMGAYRPITRRLIEMNIPRETAIYLRDHIKSSVEDRAALMTEIRQLRKTLPHWYSVQLEVI